MYDVYYRPDYCDSNATKISKIRVELNVVHPDPILYPRKKYWIPGVFAACSYTGCSDGYTKYFVSDRL